jgi:hypothetical protein
MKIMQINSIKGKETQDLPDIRIDETYYYERPFATTHASQKVTICLCVLLIQLFAFAASAQVTWPAGQLLPSFPATATTQDLIYLQTNSAEERYLFSSLQGIVNMTQPRIFVYDGDAFAEGPYAWMQSLELSWIEHADNWPLITKYRDEISGLIVYDPAQIHTVNLATMLAKDRKAIIASPSLLPKLQSSPYNLPVLLDLRGQFTSKLHVYQTLFDSYWPTLDHRLLIGLNPEVHQGSLREYAVAVGGAVVWLDPDVPGETELLNRFLGSMPVGSNYMGWWPHEGPGVSRVSTFGITTIASDFCANLSVHSGMPRTIQVKPIPPKPKLQNKIYVAFILGDGDNLQYVEHLMRKLWNNPDRGSVPMGWTLSPAMVDAMPGALNFYHQTSTPNDNLISGPSGYGYTYPNEWPDPNLLNQFVTKTEAYNERAGFRIITVWNGINGGISQPSGEAYATYAPSLLGVTAQNTGGPLSIYNNTLPGKPLSCNYCTSEQAMKEHIASASIGWNGVEPRFVIIQAQPWTNNTPTSFKNVMNSLNSNYIVVRPDHLFQLLRESKDLTVDPLGEPAATVYTDCGYTGTEAALPVDNYTSAKLQEKGITAKNISAFKLAFGYEIELFDQDNFTGRSAIINSDQSCLTRWNNKIKSLRLRAITTAGDGLIGNYFNGMNFETYVSTRKDPSINFNWGDGSSMAGVKRDTASIRWTGFIEPRYTERYTFYLTSDNGRRLWVNDQLVIDKWLDDWDITYTGEIELEAGKKYTIKIECFENFGGANCKFEWSSGSQPLEIVPQSQLFSSAAPAVDGTGKGLTGDYFSGMNFETHIATRVDPMVSFNWGDGAPMEGINNDGYTIRWTGAIQPRYSDIYKFYLTSDNGRRLWIDDQLVIDKWLNDWDITYTGEIALEAGKKYKIRIEYFENNGGANCQFEWSSISQPREVVPQSQLFPTYIEGNGDGLTGKYFNRPNFRSYVATRVDSVINFNWHAGSPMDGVNNDLFSIRWTGAIQPRYSEKYVFYLTSDNGSKLWIDDRLVINDWTNHGVDHPVEIRLKAEKKYNIRIEYFEGTGDANCVFEWSSASQPRQVVPQSQLYSIAGPDHGGDEDVSCRDVSIYPNPVQSTLYLTNIDEPVDLIILNTVGRAIATGHGVSLDVRHLHAGTYYLKINSKGEWRVFRFIKQ